MEKQTCVCSYWIALHTLFLSAHMCRTGTRIQQSKLNFGNYPFSLFQRSALLVRYNNVFRDDKNSYPEFQSRTVCALFAQPSSQLFCNHPTRHAAFYSWCKDRCQSHSQRWFGSNKNFLLIELNFLQLDVGASI